MGGFEGRVVLLTGAGRAIGRVPAEAFASHAAAIAANDISPVGLDEKASHLTASGAPARAFVADIASRMAVQTVVEDVQQAFGRVDILVDNAGLEPHGSLMSLDEWGMDQSLAVNLKGPFELAQAMGRLMADHGVGVIVKIASIAGRAHGPKDRSAYVARKLSLIGLTREAAREPAAYNIRVNAVCPGVIETEMAAALRQDPAMVPASSTTSRCIASAPRPTWWAWCSSSAPRRRPTSPARPSTSTAER
jgi:NAD(P)-dependent dehydrogenase (short-subunit alcohol dehydrogenase family)